MTPDFFSKLSSKFWQITRFPFQLGRQLHRLEASASHTQAKLEQLAQEHAQLAQDHAQLAQEHAQLAQEHAQLAHGQLQLMLDHAQLRRDHDANVAWLQGMYPEIVSAIGKKLEPEHFDQLTQDVFAALHREVGTLVDRLGALETADAASIRRPESMEDSRSAGFYLALERRFRGTADEISVRARPYLELLQRSPQTCYPVLDMGSGRGEWLALLACENIPASGVDLNPINGDYCRSRGLDVRTGDALAHLASLPAGSIGTVTAFHLVEHVPFAMLLAMTDEILRVLKPGGLLIYETPNPENLLVATQSFWIDPTHLRPLPPDLLQFLVLQRGFASTEVRRLHPGEPVATPDTTLQALLSGPRDYAIIARKASQLPA